LFADFLLVKKVPSSGGVARAARDGEGLFPTLFFVILSAARRIYFYLNIFADFFEKFAKKLYNLN
jgi:hypothetical protein